ncbi:DMT family transporter [Ligilactobacillus aviarius]|uniref:DMT family transporter n=1 Tax=Ligilactobacillus aviarius TaxID=1606 RepID=UPI000A3DF6A7|nr:DMT family transporter [Ligilactobacillus aviarius]
MQVNNQRRWIIFGAVASIFWGLSGIIAKFLFEVPQMTPVFLTQIRMICAGGIMVLLAALCGCHPFAVFRDWHAICQLLVYGVIGMIPDQLFYFITVNYGNASIATILQFVGPFFVMLYMALVHHQLPRRIEIISAVVAFIGVVTVATNGKFTHLVITPAVLLFGILSAVGVMTTTVSPRQLLQKYDALTVTGWGILIAGIALSIIHPVVPKVNLAPVNFTEIIGVILIGTIIPFLLFSVALKHVNPTIMSLLDAFEPITATFGSVILMGLTLSIAEIIGSVLIIIAVIGLNYQPKKS